MKRLNLIKNEILVNISDDDDEAEVGSNISESSDEVQDLNLPDFESGNSDDE